MKLSGKSAIVTGGASGFGAGIVRRFIAEGAKVVIADINGGAATSLAIELGENALGVQADISNANDIATMVEAAVEFLTPKDRYQSWAEENPALETMRKRLDLDLG